jgi:hypothetical protein
MSLSTLNDQLATLQATRDENLAALDALLTQAQDQVTAINNGAQTIASSLTVALAAFNSALRANGGGTVNQPSASDASSAKSFYASNPNANTPDAAGVAYWAGQVANIGTAAAQADFNRTVAAITGTAMPSYAIGTDYVARDGLAMIHQGEAVIPAAQNRAMGIGSSGLMSEFREMRKANAKLTDQVSALLAEAMNTAEATSRTFTLLRQVTRDGNAVVTTT